MSTRVILMASLFLVGCGKTACEKTRTISVPVRANWLKQLVKLQKQRSKVKSPTRWKRPAKKQKSTVPSSKRLTLLLSSSVTSAMYAQFPFWGLGVSFCPLP